MEMVEKLSEKSSLIALAFASHEKYNLRTDDSRRASSGCDLAMGTCHNIVKWNERDTSVTRDHQLPAIMSIKSDPEAAGEYDKEIATPNVYNIKSTNGACHDREDTQNSPSAEGTCETGKSNAFRVQLKNKMCLVLGVTAVLLSASCCSLITIFFPRIAQNKGMSLTTIGIVFSVFELVIFVASPFVGNFSTRIGIKFMCLSGIFVEGVSVIFFGILDKGPDGVSFAVMCVICRSVDALGFAGFYIGIVSILSFEFKKHVGLVTAVVDSTMTFGFLVGPVIGGFLFEAGGFGLPFYVVGGCVLVNGLALYMCLPEYHISEKDESNQSISPLLRSPMIIILLTTVSVAMAGTLMYTSLFATQMAIFQLRTSVLGGLFAIGPSSFIISSILWGYLSNFQTLHGPLLVLGQFTLGLSFLINESSRLFTFIPSEIWSKILSFVMMEVSVGIIQVFGVRCLLRGAHEIKYENNMSTYALVSSLYNTAFSLGGLSGPFLGGAAVDRFGFPDTYTAFGIINFCVMFVLLGYFSYRHIRRGDNTTLSGAASTNHIIAEK